MELDARNYYEILEVPFSCTQEEINQAYNRAKNSYSGDSAALYSLMTESECSEMLGLIDEAFSILGDPDKRLMYDKARGFDKARQSDDKLRKAALEEKLSGLSRSTDSMLNHEKNIVTASRNQMTKEEFDYENKREGKTTRAEAYKKFSLDFSSDKGFEQEIENATEFSGEFLKKIREYKKVTIERMAEMTKVSKTHLRNIEDEATDKLPAIAYIRGFVFQYAKCLKLNPDMVANSYSNRLKKIKEQGQQGPGNGR
ncbi:MAG: helix-turn-helix domain-containing protein [Bacteriovoracaceae bacterium]|nr:helix-turn-helix domain-containing protein [Bacteriovoracaceae bacterium]